MKLFRHGQKSVKRPRPPKPLAARKLFKNGLNDYRKNWKRYILVLAVVAVPLDLLMLIPGLANDTTFQAYSQLAVIIMNVALVWAVVMSERSGHVPRPAGAYYDGSSAMVRFLLTTIVLVLMLIPAALGTAFYVVGMVAVDAVGTFAEQLLITFICVLLALPSVLLLVRFGLAPVIAVDSGLRPFAALRKSRLLTLGRFWRVLARYVAVIFFIALTALPIALVTAGLTAIKLSALGTLIFQLATTFTALPLLFIYLLKLYRNLEDGFDSVNKPATTEADAIDKASHKNLTS